MKAQVLRRMLRIVAPSRNRGVALVITLAMVVLLTVIVVAFFARSMLNRQIEASGAGREAVDVLALSSLEALAGELLNEMRAASTVETVSSVSLFHPVSDEAVRPSRVVAEPFIGATNAKILIKQSLPNSALFPLNAPYNVTSVDRIFPAASEVSTTTASRDGRLISTNRWNTPRLLANGFDSAGVPYWVYVARSGIASDQAITPAWSDYASGNSSAIVGRVAFNVYETAGLLNANVAGYPASLTADQVRSLKGSQAGADLRRLPGVTAEAMDALVEFRNPQAGSAEAYTNYVLSGGVPAGFRSHRVPLQGGSTVTNSFFTSRQDLIRYAEVQNPALTNALPYLTHSASVLNAPSWQPRYNAQDKAGGTSNPEFQYRANATQAGSLNRDVLSVRFPANANIAGYRGDGSTFTYSVRAGEPLVQRRFPLSRLKWVGPDGPQNGGTAAAVQACFGLRWDTSESLWQYVGPTGNSRQTQIKTLDEVASEGREPNFFELLQAAILDGSLGLMGGSPQLGDPNFQKNTTFQVLRIGACLIDQYDADSYPTVIEFESPGGAPYWRAVGVENLPYVEVVRSIAGPKAGANDKLVAYVLCRLWNPHRGDVPQPRPNIRLGFAGTIRARCWWGDYPNANNNPRIPEMIATVPLSAPVSGVLSAAAAGDFREPRYPVASDFASDLTDDPGGLCWAPLPMEMGTHNGSVFAGYRLPDYQLDLSKPDPTSEDTVEARYFSTFYGFRSSAPSQWGNFLMEFQTPSGRWIPYAFWTGINDSSTWASTTLYRTVGVVGTPDENGVYPYSPKPFSRELLSTLVGVIKSDPRSTRISPVIMNTQLGMDADPQPSLWSPSAPPLYSRNGYGGGDQSGGPNPAILQRLPAPVFPVGTFYYPSWLSRNFGPNENPISCYADFDGVRRIGDSGRYKNERPSNSAPTEGNPYWREADRPAVLNRPFANVGEMAYAFRDLPWKSLDFFSENSADAALLDFFCLADADVDARIVADRVNLAATPVEVLEALLAGSPVDASDFSAQPMADSTAGNVARKFAETDTPLANPADLAIRWIGPLEGDYTNPDTEPLLADGDFSTTDEARIKDRREAIVRSLGGLSDTRTWNLLIDLIAQYGRFPPGDNDAANFIVTGEKRYWLHLAVDRFTGEIISRQLETVNE